MRGESEVVGNGEVVGEGEVEGEVETVGEGVSVRIGSDPPVQAVIVSTKARDSIATNVTVRDAMEETVTKWGNRGV